MNKEHPDNEIEIGNVVYIARRVLSWQELQHLVELVQGVRYEPERHQHGMGRWLEFELVLVHRAYDHARLEFVAVTDRGIRVAAWWDPRYLDPSI